MHIYRQPRESAAKSLLAACGLPMADLESDHFAHFFACGAEKDTPEGVVGIQIFGNAGLLRSLAVAESARGAGCGKRLVAEAEAHAARNGVSRLYLLTTTADKFFTALGYSVTTRNTAPDSIRNTPEFAGLCPSNAIFMMKKIGGAHIKP